MRKTLAKQDGVRKKFIGVLSRMGKKINYKGYSESTVLLTNICDALTKTCVADHLWFTYTKGFEKIGFQEGRQIEFEARIKEYKKGYVNARIGLAKRTTDYKLSHPTKIKMIATINAADAKNAH